MEEYTARLKAAGHVASCAANCWSAAAATHVRVRSFAQEQCFRGCPNIEDTPGKVPRSSRPLAVIERTINGSAVWVSVSPTVGKQIRM